MTSIDAQQLGERIPEHRVRQGLSQDQLAAGISADRSVISKIEAGIRKVSALELAQAAAHELGHFLVHDQYCAEGVTFARGRAPLAPAAGVPSSTQ